MTLGAFGEDSPSRRRLAAVLRELRRGANLSGERLAEQLDTSQSKVSRIELGQSMPTTAEVESWAQATGASAAQRSELLELVETASSEAVSFRRQRQRRGLAGLQQETAQLEASAGTIRAFHPVLVPGLLQTPPYARAVYEAAHPGERGDSIAGAVAARMNRQAILYDPTKRFAFVLTEAGLRWRLAPRDVLLGQLDRLATVAALPNVDLGILPITEELTAWHSHGFNLFGDRLAGEPVVHVETLTDGLNVRDPEDVGRYREAFDRLMAAALTDTEARALLEHIANDTRHDAA